MKTKAAVPRKLVRPGAERIPSQSKARFLDPMLCLSTSSLPEGDEWQYELKLDGYRALAIKTVGKVLLRSRNDKDFSTRYRSIADALKKVPDETIIDGEVVAFDESGRPSFNRLQNYGSSQVPIYYYAFDLPMLAGRDLTSLALDERRHLAGTTSAVRIGRSDPVFANTGIYA